MLFPGATRVRRLRCGARHAVLLLVIFVLVPIPCAADVFHLKRGGSVRGEIIEETAETVRIRTAIGTMVLRRDSVLKIERTDSVLDAYAERVEGLANEADAHASLAAWCAEVGLPREAKKHFKRAIELDPDHAAAREALGFVKLNGIWVDSRSTKSRKASEETRKSERERAARAQSERAQQGRWAMRLRILKRQYLDSSDRDRVRAGRKKVLEITDPLAILPLVETLGDGNRACRAVLLEALAKLDYDESTLNLAALSLLEDDPELRHFAVSELKRRDDPRVVAQFRKALTVDHDEIVRRAASAFVVLQERSAIPELIDALTVQRQKYVEVPVRQYFGSFPGAFAQPEGGVRLGFNGGVFVAPRIGVHVPTWIQQNVEFRRVTVFRTEVLEALKATTGQNFGFEREEWWRWHNAQQPGSTQQEQRP